MHFTTTDEARAYLMREVLAWGPRRVEEGLRKLVQPWEPGNEPRTFGCEFEIPVSGEARADLRDKITCVLEGTTRE